MTELMIWGNIKIEGCYGVEDFTRYAHEGYSRESGLSTAPQKVTGLPKGIYEVKNRKMKYRIRKVVNGEVFDECGMTITELLNFGNSQIKGIYGKDILEKFEGR